MTTEAIIKELRAMAAQCIDAPEPKKFFTETADRLEDLNRIKYAGQKTLDGTVPVILYVPTMEDAEELMREVHKANRNMIARTL